MHYYDAFPSGGSLHTSLMGKQMYGEIMRTMRIRKNHLIKASFTVRFNWFAMISALISYTGVPYLYHTNLSQIQVSQLMRLT